MSLRIDGLNAWDMRQVLCVIFEFALLQNPCLIVISTDTRVTVKIAVTTMQWPNESHLSQEGHQRKSTKVRALLCFVVVRYRSVYIYHDDVIKWKHFPSYWSFVNSAEFPAQRPVTRNFDISLISGRINGWVNNGEAGDLRRHRTHFDVILMILQDNFIIKNPQPNFNGVFNKIPVEVMSLMSSYIPLFIWM